MQKLGKTIVSIALFMGIAVPAMAADVTGIWAVSLNTDGGAGMMNITLQQEGEVLKGTTAGDVGEAPITGKVENETVTFSHDLPDYGISATYSGKVEGNKIVGEVEFGGGAAFGSFTAEKQE